MWALREGHHRLTILECLGGTTNKILEGATTAATTTTRPRRKRRKRGTVHATHGETDNPIAVARTGADVARSEEEYIRVDSIAR